MYLLPKPFLLLFLSSSIFGFPWICRYLPNLSLSVSNLSEYLSPSFFYVTLSVPLSATTTTCFHKLLHKFLSLSYSLETHNLSPSVSLLFFDFPWTWEANNLKMSIRRFPDSSLFGFYSFQLQRICNNQYSLQRVLQILCKKQIN